MPLDSFCQGTEDHDGVQSPNGDEEIPSRELWKSNRQFPGELFDVVEVCEVRVRQERHSILHTNQEESGKLVLEEETRQRDFLHYLAVVGDPAALADLKSVLARIPTGGWLKPDGSDIAIQNAAGQAIPVTIRSFDPKAEETLFFPRLVGG